MAATRTGEISLYGGWKQAATPAGITAKYRPAMRLV
jgi:hypothetical protein